MSIMDYSCCITTYAVLDADPALVGVFGLGPGRLRPLSAASVNVDVVGPDITESFDDKLSGEECWLPR